MERTDLGLREVLCDLSDQLDRSPFGCTLLENSSDLNFESDVDIVLKASPNRDFFKLVTVALEQHGFTVLHFMHYEVKAGYYVIARSESLGYLHLDFLWDPKGVNSYWIPTDYFLVEQNRIDGLNYANSKKLALYKFVKRIRKSIRNEGEADAISGVVANHEEFIEQEFERLFRIPIFDELARILNGTLDEKIHTFAHLFHRIQVAERYQFSTITRFISTLKKNVKRFMTPTGVFVVLIGPDGCGKSTVADNLLRDFTRGFRSVERFHWRPGLLPKLSNRSSDGASTSLTSSVSAGKRIFSTLRFLYYSVDFILGYWLLLYPKKAQCTFVIGERYFGDVLVHPKRYGFHVPECFRRGVSFLVPNPDLTIFLTNDSKVIHERKPELEVEVIETLNKLYQEEIGHWGKSLVVKTDISSDEVARVVGLEVLGICSRRHKERIA